MRDGFDVTSTTVSLRHFVRPFFWFTAGVLDHTARGGHIPDFSVLMVEELLF